MSNFFDNPDNITLVLGGLALLIVALVVIVLFWRMSHQTRASAPLPPSQPPAPVKPIATTTPPAPSRSIEITLEFPADSGQPVIFTLDKPALTVGRGSDNDIVIPSSIPNADTVSTHHARLRRDQDDYIVRDLGSKNGLTVNGRHTLENLLQDGDRLSFGTAAAIFHRPLSSGSPEYHSGSRPGGAA